LDDGVKPIDSVLFVSFFTSFILSFRQDTAMENLVSLPYVVCCVIQWQKLPDSTRATDRLLRKISLVLIIEYNNYGEKSIEIYFSLTFHFERKFINEIVTPNSLFVSPLEICTYAPHANMIK
jgi:hypothetical protein